MMAESGKSPRVNQPTLLWVMVGLLVVLLAGSVLFCWEALVGTPAWSEMSDKQVALTILPLAIVTNLYLIYIAGLIVGFCLRKLTLVTVIVLAVIAGVVNVKLTVAAAPVIEVLEQRAE